MSWAFAGNRPKTAEYEEMVIAYWKTQEEAAPQNAFYQQGEMANEAAPVCIDSGDDVAAARAALPQIKDADPKLYAQQTAFLPYLTGYVALYTGDSTEALRDLSQANQSDAYIQCLIGMAYEKAGDQQRALEIYRKAAAAGTQPAGSVCAPLYSRQTEIG